MEGLQPKKLGILFSPPTLILLYKTQSNCKKLSMPIRELSVTSDCSVLASRLQARHKKQLSSVNIIAIEKMIRLIQEVIKGHDKSAALEIVSKEYLLNPDEDLNRLNDKELKRRKAIMDLNFKKNNIDKDHPDFVYDKEVDFSGEKKTSGWDSETSDDEGDSTPRPISKTNDKNDDFENGELYPVQKSPAPPISSGVELNESVDNSVSSNDSFKQEDNQKNTSSPSKENSKPLQPEFLSGLTESLNPPLSTNLAPIGLNKPESSGSLNNLGPPAGLTGKPRSLLDPLPVLGKVSSAPPLHKALPPLDLKGVNSMAPKVTHEPVPKVDIKTDAKNDESEDESFSDDSELLPAVNVKMSPNKKLFGLIDSDEENPPNKNGAKTPADSEKIGAKTFLEKEISPRSISQGDVSNNEEDDSW